MERKRWSTWESSTRKDEGLESGVVGPCGLEVWCGGRGPKWKISPPTRWSLLHHGVFWIFNFHLKLKLGLEWVQFYFWTKKLPSHLWSAEKRHSQEAEWHLFSKISRCKALGAGTSKDNHCPSPARLLWSFPYTRKKDALVWKLILFSNASKQVGYLQSTDKHSCSVSARGFGEMVQLEGDLEQLLALPVSLPWKIHFYLH